MVTSDPARCGHQAWWWVKLSPLGIAVSLAAIGVVLMIWKPKRPSRLGIMLLVQPVVAGAVFVLSYPYLWRNPIEYSLNLLISHDEF